MSLMLAALISMSQAATPPAPRSARRYLSCSLIESSDGPPVIIDRLPYLTFETGSARITPQGAATLDAFVAGYDAPPYCEVVIEGHADRVGPADRNLRLSRRRAEAVATYLLRKGMTAPLMIRDRGEMQPLVDTADEVPEFQNRYVSIWIYDPHDPWPG